MAGQLKEVRNRIKSVQSTQQITKAMKMVSAAKLQTCAGYHSVKCVLMRKSCRKC